MAKRPFPLETSTTIRNRTAFLFGIEIDFLHIYVTKDSNFFSGMNNMCAILDKHLHFSLGPRPNPVQVLEDERFAFCPNQFVQAAAIEFVRNKDDLLTPDPEKLLLGALGLSRLLTCPVVLYVDDRRIVIRPTDTCRLVLEKHDEKVAAAPRQGPGRHAPSANLPVLPEHRPL